MWLQSATVHLARGLRAAVLVSRAVVLWILFKLLQVIVGASFTLLIVSQAAVAGVARLLFGEPTALRKVHAAREAQFDQSAAQAQNSNSCAEDGKSCRRRTNITARVFGDEPIKPMHVFTEPEKGHDSEAWQLLGPQMRQYGRHAIANSQLFNPEFIHFYLPGIGSLPYVVVDVYNRAVVVGVGEPLCHRSQWRYITELFLKEFPEAYFHHISGEYAEVLHDMGYYINFAGAETTLQVQSWTYTAKTRTVRSAARSARDAGVRVRELRPDELTPELRHRLKHEVSGDWLQQKAVADRELRVFVRNVDYEHIQLRDGVRIFVAEAYDPAAAPPTVVDPVLQGAALNAKPPKPPRSKSSRSLKSQASTASLTACDSSHLSTAGSSGSLSSLPSLGKLLNLDSIGWSRRSGAAAANTTAANTSSCSPDPRTRAGSPSSDGSTSPNSIATTPNSSSDGSTSSTSLAGTPPACSTAASSAGSSPRSEYGVTVKVTRISTTTTAATEHGQKQREPAANRDNAADTPFAAAAAAAAVSAAASATAVVAAEAAAAGGDVDGCAVEQQQPELMGFVLLDPLWEDGQEIGYVSSIMRMKRNAHPGTLKLLCEDIISTMRQEGKKELAFGFSPLFNMRDDRSWRYLHWMRWVALYIFYCANNVYAFKNLAFSKVRYGAGLTQKGDGFRDPNVKMTHIHMAAKHYLPGWIIVDLYGFFTFVGMIDSPVGVFCKLVGLRKGGANIR